MRRPRPQLARPLLLILCHLVVTSGPAHADWQSRGLLWRVVQGCLLNHAVTGAAFPCLSVDTSSGVASGFAVLRAPREASHVIVTPTVRTIGVEAVRLRGAAAPFYFHDAWLSRRFVTNGLGAMPQRDDLAMAVNSRLGRSQDQLHIHVACLRPRLKAAVARIDAKKNTGWTHMRLPTFAYSYAVHYEPSRDLAGVNIIDLVASGLKIAPSRMDSVTIVVIGVEPTGFLIFARARVPHGFDAPHGEYMLDPDCTPFRRS